MRWVVLAVLFGIVLVVLCTAAALGAGAAQERAMTRCTATPLPSRLTRDGTTITVDWKLFPCSYSCVYETPDGTVRRPPP
jgi:hypothetical protein